MKLLFACTVLCTLIFTCLSDEQVQVSIEDVSDDALDEKTKKVEFVLAVIYSDKTENIESMKQTLEILEKVSQSGRIQDLSIVKVKNSRRVTEHGFRSLPKVLFFRKDLPILYDADLVESEDMIDWMEQNREVTLKTLTDDTFEHLTQAATGATTGDWFVMFYQKKCSGSLPNFEAAASRLKHKMVFARVDIGTSPKLEKRFKISKCPTLLFFHLGKMYAYDLPNKEVQNLINFAEGFYKNSKMESVPVETSPFDDVVEKIASTLKEKMQGGDRKLYIIGGISAVVILLVTVVCCCCCRKDGRRHPKFD